MIARKVPLEPRPFPRSIRVWKALMAGVLIALATMVVVPAGVATAMRTQSPDSATVARVPATGQLVVVRDGHARLLAPDGKEVRDIGNVRGFSLAKLSPDRQNIALVSDDLTTVASMSLIDGSIRVIAEDKHSGHTNVRWSADGTLLYFVRIPQRAGLDDPWSMLVVSSDGGAPTDMAPRDNATFDQLLPLPDGRILFESQTRRGVVEAMTMFIADASGRDARPLLHGLPKGKSCLNPDLSADGSRLVLACSSGGPETASLIVFELAAATSSEISTPTVLPRWSGSGMIVGLSWFAPGECPDQIVQVNPTTGKTGPIHTEGGAFLRISGMAGSLALVESSRCNNGQSSPNGHAFWLDPQGRTFQLGDAAQARWLGGR